MKDKKLCSLRKINAIVILISKFETGLNGWEGMSYLC